MNIKWVAILVLLAEVGTASAQEAGDSVYHHGYFSGTQSLGMAGARRALATGNGAVYLNPAGMSQAGKYVIDGNYLHRGDVDAQAYGLSIVDSQTAEVAAGLGYIYWHAFPGEKGDKGETAHQLDLALSHSLGTKLFIGATGRWLRERGIEDKDLYTADAGVLFKPIEYLSFGAVGYNLVPTDDRRLPVTLGVGGALKPSTHFLFDFDWVAKFDGIEGDTYRYLTGMEFMLYEHTTLRAGYGYDNHRSTEVDDRHFVSGGLSLISGGAALGFGLRQDLGDRRARDISFSLTLFLPTIPRG